MAVVLGLLAVLVPGLPTMAKEGAEARLDTALPRDAEPGSRIEVGWSVATMEGDKSYPVYGSPVYIRLVGPDGTSTTEVMGTEVPPGSGHYTASIAVPDGGIGEVIVGMVGEACTADGCQRSDLIFPLTDDPLVSGAAPVASPATKATAGTPATAARIGADVLPIIAIGVAFALAGALGALVLGRRRVIGAPTGR